MPTKVERSEKVEIVVSDERGFVFSVYFDEDGEIRSLSGELLGVRGSGERVPIDSLALLQAVFREGVRFAATGRPSKW